LLALDLHCEELRTPAAALRLASDQDVKSTEVTASNRKRWARTEFSLTPQTEDLLRLPIIPGETIMKVLLLSAVISILLPLVVSTSAAQTPATSAPGALLGPSDAYFVSQTSLGTPFQVDSGRVAEAKGTTPAIRSYANLMVSSHITVNNALLEILKNKAAAPPPTLLQAAYATMVATLQHESGHSLDADYVRGQVNYQKANAALYQYEISNGTDPDLKAFAQQTLPKIQDHLARALKLEARD